MGKTAHIYDYDEMKEGAGTTGFVGLVEKAAWETGDYGEQLAFEIRPLDHEASWDSGIYQTWFPANDNKFSLFGVLMEHLKNAGIGIKDISELVGKVFRFEKKRYSFKDGVVSQVELNAPNYEQDEGDADAEDSSIKGPPKARWFIVAKADDPRKSGKKRVKKEEPEDESEEKEETSEEESAEEKSDEEGVDFLGGETKKPSKDDGKFDGLVELLLSKEGLKQVNLKRWQAKNGVPKEELNAFLNDARNKGYKGKKLVIEGSSGEQVLRLK